MQIESRTCQACLSNYAEMQLCFCKLTPFPSHFHTFSLFFSLSSTHNIAIAVLMLTPLPFTKKPLDVGFTAFIQRQTKIHDRIIRLTLMKYLFHGYY